MKTRKATAKWRGTLKDGDGIMSFRDYEGPYTYASRFEEGRGTNPDEMAGAALAGCFSMFLSALLSKDNYKPTSIETSAFVHLGEEDGPKITLIELDCKADVPELDAEAFNEYAKKAKTNCPISRLFTGTEIKLSAKLA